MAGLPICLPILQPFPMRLLVCLPTGLNVAAMAGLPNIVVQRAALRASELRQAIQQGKEAMQQSRIGAATAAGDAHCSDLHSPKMLCRHQQPFNHPCFYLLP
eukprot:1140396-Pelagomonas_calceolata.AAC.5